jgi:hypothetical protein
MMREHYLLPLARLQSQFALAGQRRISSLEECIEVYRAIARSVDTASDNCGKSPHRHLSPLQMRSHFLQNSTLAYLGYPSGQH